MAGHGVMTMDIDDSAGLEEDNQMSTEGNSSQLSALKWRKRPHRAVNVCLGLLCLFLLAGIIPLGVHYHRAENKQMDYSEISQEKEAKLYKLTESRDQLQTRNYNLTEERDQYNNRYINITEERDQLLISYNNLTKEKDQLKDSYDSLKRERDQLLIRNNDLSKDKDQLQTSKSNLSKEREQLQASNNNLREDKDQLQTSYNTLTKEKDQLRTNYTSLKEERDQLETSYNNLTKERDKLSTSYLSLKEERDQLQASYNNVTQGGAMNYSSLMEERAELLSEVQRLNETIKELTKCHTEWTYFDGKCYYGSMGAKSWSNARQDCKRRGADLVIIKSSRENEFLRKFQDKIWIGLSDRAKEGEWLWVDGSAVTTGYWAPGEPNNAGREDCAELVKSSGTWNDVPCTQKLSGVCVM